MQRRAFLMRAGAGVAATAVARPAIAQTGAPVRWRLATSWPKSLDTLYGSVEAYVSARGATDREEIPDPELRWRGNHAVCSGARKI